MGSLPDGCINPVFVKERQHPEGDWTIITFKWTNRICSQSAQDNFVTVPERVWPCFVWLVWTHHTVHHYSTLLGPDTFGRGVLEPLANVTIPLCNHFTTMAAVYKQNDSMATESVKWQSRHFVLFCTVLRPNINYTLRSVYGFGLRSSSSVAAGQRGSGKEVPSCCGLSLSRSASLSARAVKESHMHKPAQKYSPFFTLAVYIECESR